MSNPNDVLSVADVSLILGRGIQSVRQYMRVEGLPYAKVAGRYVILRCDLEEWADRAETRDMFARGDLVLTRLGKPVGKRQLANAD